MYGSRDPRVPLTGFEPGLVSLWTFTEGRGTVTVDSASWRKPAGGAGGSGIARFGVLSPAVAIASPSTVLSTSDGSNGASQAIQNS